MNIPPNSEMPIPSAFLADDDEKTFQHENHLPSLPVPPLNETLNKYLDSVRPHLNNEEFQRTKDIVHNFGNGIGKQLHMSLLEMSKHKKNWLEKWWEEYAYLRTRMPHAPYVNFGGPPPFSQDYWPPKIGTQVERIAMTVWYTLKFWECMRKEKIRVNRNNKNVVLSMHQFYCMFNGCKTPGETCDTLHHYFKTETEGPVATHLLVICRGRYFVFDALDSKGEILSVPELELQIQHIRSLCDGQPEGPAVGTLTGDNRTVWFQQRNHLISIHPENERHLELIQNSIFAIALDDRCPSTQQEAAFESLVGDAKSRWFDKTLTLLSFKNGLIGQNCDHAPHDAMINIALGYFTYLGFESCKYTWKGPRVPRVLLHPKELVFHVDDQILKAIASADSVYKQARGSIELVLEDFKFYGKDFVRSHNLHPDAFVQMAIQLAYYRLHRKPAPTYETATTRKFYHGRTETLRSCTTEAIEFAKSMLDSKSSKQNRLRLFRTAHNKHIQSMEEATENRGCDRHLFGLYLVALEQGLPTPDIFLDEAYLKSGGGGNFILSTSFIGYTPMSGGVAPMCKDGYGCFYSILPDRFIIFVDCWMADTETSAPALYKSLEKSLLEMKELLDTTVSAKL